MEILRSVEGLFAGMWLIVDHSLYLVSRLFLRERVYRVIFHAALKQFFNYCHLFFAATFFVNEPLIVRVYDKYGKFVKSNVCM